MSGAAGLGHHAARRVMQGDQTGLSKLGALNRQHTCAQIHVRQRELAHVAEAQAGDAQQAEQTVVRPWPQSTLARQRERRLEQASDLRVRVDKQKNSADLWAEAIEMARRELSPAENRVLQLKAAIRTFKRNLARGDAFPGQVEK